MKNELELLFSKKNNEITNIEIVELFKLTMPYPYKMNFGEYINMETQVTVIAMNNQKSEDPIYEQELFKSFQRLDSLANELGLSTDKFDEFISFLMNEKLQIIDNFKFTK